MGKFRGGGMIGGYCNRILRVDLTSQHCTVTSLPDEATLRTYIGGIGLGMKLLLDETRPGLHASAPESPLILLAGPLAGTSAPSSSNLAIVSLDYNMPFAVASNHSHGYWAAYLKHAGYDGVVVVGKSEKPVFLWVADDHVEIRDASMLWGLDTRETERLIKGAQSDEAKISVACIGPAGEAMLPGAGIRNDRIHAACEGGVGAIMGSKRLKAIAVRGSKPVPLNDAIRFEKVARQWAHAGDVERLTSDARIVSQGVIGRLHAHAGWRALGSASLSNPIWKERFSKRLFSAVAHSWTVLPRKSYNCNKVCAYDCHINEGEFGGIMANMSGGAENLAGIAAVFGIEDPAVAIALTDYFDAMGLDSYIGGALIGAAFTLYSRGALTERDTDGIQLTWGNFEAACELLDQMIEGRGFGGRVLVKGLRDGAHILGLATKPSAAGQRSDDMTTPSWQRRWNSLLADVFSDTSASSRIPGWELQPLEPISSYKAASGFAEQQSKTNPMVTASELWEGCLGVCGFACENVKGALDYATQAMVCATGWADFCNEEALLVADRIAAMQRRFAIEH